MDPSQPLILFHLAQSCLKIDKPISAFRYLKTCLQLDPEYTEARQLLEENVIRQLEIAEK
jgi:hypothetical protein